MSTYSGNSLKSGLKILIDCQPYEVQYSEFIKPGKGQAFVRIKLKQLLTGKLLCKTVKATDIFYSTDIVEVHAAYLYNNGITWFFMNKKSFEHIHVSKKYLSNFYKWITIFSNCIITLWNNSPISVSIDNFIELKVCNTEAAVKGDTVNTSNKLVTLETGATIRVPLFIKIGDYVKIDTRTERYVSRVIK
ncbi:elongation factor P [Buchnera aphidicola]|uniref:Elongation factor P n=1 Tax=Buchnera aphidicola (Cinara strobi) TaxID=1921549 RepID=A0A3B1DZV9_9GAMM|nr:elongation factor P [Buchnera aphidicola]VAX76205.1 Elongation factor P [Buchnera aphidicola (Cinara strobi)]